MVKLSDVKLLIECKCPNCGKEIKTEINNLWVSASNNDYNDPKVEEIEMIGKCPNCKHIFNVDFLN